MSTGARCRGAILFVVRAGQKLSFVVRFSTRKLPASKWLLCYFAQAHPPISGLCAYAARRPEAWILLRRVSTAQRGGYLLVHAGLVRHLVSLGVQEQSDPVAQGWLRFCSGLRI